MVTVLEEIMKRRSSRAFDTRPVSQEIIDSIIEAGRWAPSCMNTQAWNFVVLTDPDALLDAHESLSRGNAYAKEAPVMVVVAAKEDGGCSSHRLPYFMMDVGLATQNMLIQAVHVGLIGHPTAGWNEESLKETLGIPVEYRIVTVVFFGFRKDLDTLDDEARERETKPRTRKPLHEIVHTNEW